MVLVTHDCAWVRGHAADMRERDNSDNAVEEDDVEDSERLSLEYSLGKREEDHTHVHHEEGEISEEHAHIATNVLNTPLHHVTPF